MIHRFTLHFTLPEGTSTEGLLDSFYEAGCDDALIGFGAPGRLAFEFSREAGSAHVAVCSAIEDIQKVVPRAELTEVGPDLVNLAEAAELLGCSRQNLRKYASGEIKTLTVSFPAPVYSGSPSLYRLMNLAEWAVESGRMQIAPEVIDLAEVAACYNAERFQNEWRPIVKWLAP